MDAPTSMKEGKKPSLPSGTHVASALNHCNSQVCQMLLRKIRELARVDPKENNAAGPARRVIRVLHLDARLCPVRI